MTTASTSAPAAAPLDLPSPQPADPAPDPGAGIFSAVRGKIAVTVALAVLGALTAVVPFVAIAGLARTLLPALDGQEVDSGRAWRIVVVCALAVVVRVAATMAAGMVGHLADNDMQLTVRHRVVAHLRTLPLGWFSDRSSGAVKKAVENDVSALHHLVAHSIVDLVQAAVTPVLLVAYLFTVEWRTATASLLPLVLMVLLFPWMMQGAGPRYVAYDASMARLNAACVEFSHGIAVVKTFGQVGSAHRRYTEETESFVDFYDDWMSVSRVPMALIEMISSPVVVLTYLAAVSAALVSSGQVDPVDTVPALLTVLGITAPFMAVASSGQNLRDALKAKTSLEELLATPPMPQPAASATVDGAAVAVDDVSFSYDGVGDAVASVTADLPQGSVTALVGPSGSGKSTLARLVPRFMDVREGTVRVGGADVREVREADLLAHVGFVFQDPYLLRTTVRDNIRLTRPEATAEQVQAAALAAQIHERILALPRGYDSVVGEDANLSGGEQQRVAIARGLVSDAPVLVLDEATAFADPDSEAAIQKALSVLARDRTLLVIAHRLHTVTEVDQVLVMDRGRVVERGTHAQLRDAGGLYQSLWDTYQQSRSGGQR